MKVLYTSAEFAANAQALRAVAGHLDFTTPTGQELLAGDLLAAMVADGKAVVLDDGDVVLDCGDVSAGALIVAKHGRNIARAVNLIYGLAVVVKPLFEGIVADFKALKQ